MFGLGYGINHGPGNIIGGERRHGWLLRVIVDEFPVGDRWPVQYGNAGSIMSSDASMRRFLPGIWRRHNGKFCGTVNRAPVEQPAAGSRRNIDNMAIATGTHIG